MTATQSEKKPWWQKEPHSAGPHSPEDDRAGPNASTRAQAREGSGPSAQFQGDSAPKSAVTEGDGNAYDWAAVWVEWRDRITQWAAVFTPPDIWSQDRPSLSKRWDYACRGEWTTKTGLPRRLGQVYAWYALTVSAVLLCLDWVVERFARHAVLVGLLYMLAQFPPLSWLT